MGSRNPIRKAVSIVLTCTLLSAVVLKKITHVFNYVKTRTTDVSLDLPNCLACAIYTGDTGAALDLLRLGTVADEGCLRAYCQVNENHSTRTLRVIKQPLRHSRPVSMI